MVREAIMLMTSEESVSESWNAMFRYFNERRDKGPVGYATGEKIFIKVNLVGGHRVRMDANLVRIPHNRYGNSHTSPQVVLSIMRQLVNECGVPQDMICVGDPSKNINDDYWQLWTAEFPDVHYVSQYGELGRELAVAGDAPVIFYSDKGQVLSYTQDYLCRQLEEADYLINLGALKAHARAGITLCVKNHYGSQLRGDASHLHKALPGETPGYGKYRTLVDLMGHEKLGGNTLLYLVDGLYAAFDANVTEYDISGLPANTTYFFRVRAWNGSFLSDYSNEISVTLEPVGIGKYLQENTLPVVYPNPFSTGLTLYFGQGPEGKAEIRVYGSTGTLLKVFSQDVLLSGNATSIQLEDLDNGLYYISVKMNGRQYVLPVIKQQ